MDSGFYAACAGLRAQSQALDIAAQNMANVSTAGFRGQQASFQTLQLASARNSEAAVTGVARALGSLNCEKTVTFDAHIEGVTGGLQTARAAVEMGAFEHSEIVDGLAPTRPTRGS